MTVAEMMKRNEEMALPKGFAEALFQAVEVWENSACLGYCIRAMENAGFDEEHIRSAVRGMHRAFDELTTEDAKEIWRKW